MRKLAYKNYLLVVLTALVTFNYVDRLALGVMLEDIKADLHLTDTQLGFLSGIAFALFYSVMGIPIARWADRGNRVTIISVTTALWSVAVALCGMAGSFVQMLGIRIAVAVGEAGCVPPAFSLIADSFNRAERPRASAIYGLGGPLACVVGFFSAGWLNEFYGWRMTFVILSAPGIVLSVVAWLTLREPRRSPVTSPEHPTPAVDVAASQVTQPTLREVCKTLWASRTFRHVLLSLSVNFFFGYGILQWQPAFFVRSFGLSTGEIGTWLAFAVGFGGLIGSYVGGELAARYAPQNERLQMRAMAMALICCAVATTLTYLSTNPYVAFLLIGVFEFALGLTNGPLFATIQTLVPERMRASAFGLVFCAANLIGMGLGPLAAGAVSDGLRPLLGEESLRYSLVVLAPGYFWSAWHLWRGSQTVAREIAAVHMPREDTPLNYAGASQRA